jgi:hypothetical protein
MVVSHNAKIIAIIFIPIIVIGLVFGVYLSLNERSSNGVGSNTSTTGQNGLELELGISRTSLLPGDTFSINVSEYNTLNGMNNVSTATNWPMNDLQLGSCGHSIYPFGIAIFGGVYAANNISEATQLQVFPDLPCPLFLRLVTGYLFEPVNDSATILPGNTTLVSLDMQISLRGFYSNGTQRSFPTGEYTVLAGDEWGDVAFQYFSVN